MRRLGNNIMQLYYNVMSKEEQIEDKSIDEQIKEKQEELVSIQKEYEMEIIVEPLQIMLQTNVPSQPNFEFTSNLIHIPDNEPPIKRDRLNKYPYICTNYEYPSTVLMSLSYNAIIEFFFNADTMISTMNSSKVQSFKKKSKTEAEEYNIQLMIKLLFPTKFLIPINLHQSIDIVLKSSTFPHHFFFNPNQIRYSYMQLGSEVYTTSRVTWINDLLNHKEFSTLMKKTYFANKVLRKTSVEKSIVELQKTKLNTEIQKLKDAIDENKQLLVKEYNDSVEAFKSSLNDYEKQHNDLFEKQDSDSEYIPSDADDDANDGDDDDADDGAIRTQSGRVSRPVQRYMGGNDDQYTSTQLKDTLEKELKTFLEKIKEGEKLPDEVIDDLQYDIERFTGDIDRLNDKIEQLNKQLEGSTKNSLEPFINTEYTNLEPPINIHNVYLHNMLKINLSKEFPSQNIKNFYDKVLPLFIRARDRKDNELTSGNRYFKDLLYGGIGKKEIKGDGIHSNLQHFYDSMNKVYKKYIRNDTSVRIKKERKILYTGVDEIFFKFPKPGVPKRRVYFIIELIEGAVNDENRDVITCPYTGEYLGALFEKIFYGNSMFGWKVKPAEYLYSVKTETTEYSKSNVKDGEQERNEEREEQNLIRQEAEAPLFELNELTRLFEPEKKRDGETTSFNEEKFDDFFDILINDDNIQSLFENAANYDIRHPQRKQLYIAKETLLKELNVRTRLIRLDAKSNKDGLLQELSKYYDTDLRNDKLKNDWQQHKTQLEFLQGQLQKKLYEANMSDEDIFTEEKKVAIIKYLIAIMNHAEVVVSHFFNK